MPNLPTGTKHLHDASIGSIPSDNATMIDDRSDDSCKFPNCIPTRRPGRNLILCFDGTGDQFDFDNSNIVEFFGLLKKEDIDQQRVYYQAGIGTYCSPAIASPLKAKIAKVLDLAIAWNLSAHVMDGYEFLMQNYREGDRICIFGFSRGAYTARCLAGMIYKVGLLPVSNRQQVPFAYKMYEDITRGEQSRAFKKTFSMDVPIEFLGLWDTVNSVGQFSNGRGQPIESSYSIIRTFRHAVALDERRIKFQTNLWNRAKDAKLRPTTSDGSEENRHTRKPGSVDIQEVWFAGCHCDVGGGSVKNGTQHSLARIPLRWMVRECFKAESGIIFISEALRAIGMDLATLYPEVKPRRPSLPVLTDMHIRRVPPGAKGRKPTKENACAEKHADMDKSEEEHERLDALSPKYDQLRLAPVWWILELVPAKHRYQREDDMWASHRCVHIGRGRSIPKQEATRIMIHRSVKMRMDAEYADGKKYTPKASFEVAAEHDNVEWVD
ncbi:hypothetical protein FPV67DRAFT_1494961 [Lyophyllum atratum]|nr:hypothetical protein FPV67DRAFT_1494961 [Lyophyllum atratum]